MRAMVALVLALLPQTTAARTVDLLWLEVMDRNGGCAAGTRRCAVVADEGGSCAPTARLCVGSTARIARLRVAGGAAVAGTITAAVAALPNGTRARRWVTFAPPLGPGCVDAGPLTMPASTRVRLTIVARAAGGRLLRIPMQLMCTPGTPAPPPPPPNPSPGPPTLRFVRSTVDPTGGGQLTSGVAAGDLDGDGRPDVVVAGFDRLLWYRNPAWIAAVIAEGDAGRGAKVVVRDVDGDGRLDVVTGVLGEPRQTVWFRNTPDAWVRYTLSAEGYCHDLVFGDLDGDGRADGFCVDQLRGRLLAFLAPADPTAVWPVVVIDGDHNSMGAALADVDGDGRLDAVTGRSWYRNVGDGTWQRVVYAPDGPDEPEGYAGFHDYAEVSVADVNGDGRPDVLATLYAECPVGRFAAFLAPADPVSQPWHEVPIDPGPLFGVHGQAAASFDGSLRPQVLVAETNIGGFGFGVNPAPQMLVYRLLGAADEPRAWERTVIDTVGTHEASVVDLDGDGRPDVIGHEENTDVVGRFGAVDAWFNRTR